MSIEASRHGRKRTSRLVESPATPVRGKRPVYRVEREQANGTGPTRPGSRMQTAALFAAAFVALLYVVEVIDISVGNRLDAAGVRPLEVDGLDGILFAPMLHAGWAH